MPDAAAIARNPCWLPHTIDSQRGTVGFVRIAMDRFEAPGFLAQLEPGDVLDQADLGFEQVMALAPPPGVLHFVFHSGFCRSTLMVRALGALDGVLALNEPEMLNTVARLPDLEPALIARLLALLARPRVPGGTVVVKPSNFANRLLPVVLSARRDARVLAMTDRLDVFLEAVARKGMAGRQWGRQTYLAAVLQQPGRALFDARTIAAMTDMQLAGLGWLLTQDTFAQAMGGSGKGRIAVLHGETLDRQRGSALASAAAHLNLTPSTDAVAAVVAGDMFARDAKTGGSYTDSLADHARMQAGGAEREEIAEVVRWIDEIARVSALTVPVPETLPL